MKPYLPWLEANEKMVDFLDDVVYYLLINVSLVK